MVSEKNTKAEIYKEYEELIRRAYSDDIDVPDDIDGLTAKETKSVLLEAVEELQDMIGEVYTEYEHVSFDTETGATTPEKPDRTVPSRESKSRFVMGTGIDILNSDILEKIKAIEDTVNFRREILSNLDELESELSAFIDIINNDRKKYSDTVLFGKQKLEAEIQKKQAELNAATADNETAIEAVSKHLEEVRGEIERKKQLRDEQRAEEEEQYEYDQKIQISREDDAWEDRSSKREQAIRVMNDNIQSLREELRDKEKCVPDLQAKLEKLPELLEKARKDGAEERRKEMEEENNHQVELSKRNSAAQYEEIEHMLDNLKNDYEERLQERDNLRIKLDRAYEESNKLYIQTVQSTGGIKILAGTEKN